MVLNIAVNIPAPFLHMLIEPTDIEYISIVNPSTATDVLVSNGMNSPWEKMEGSSFAIDRYYGHDRSVVILAGARWGSEKGIRSSFGRAATLSLCLLRSAGSVTGMRYWITGTAPASPTVIILSETPFSLEFLKNGGDIRHRRWCGWHRRRFQQLC